MIIEFVYEPHEYAKNKTPLMIVSAIREALTYEDYKKVAFLCYADITSDEAIKRKEESK